MPTEAEIQAQEAAAENEKVTFDDRQQKKVNDLLKEAQGRAGREARQEAETLKSELASLKSDLENAKREVATAKTPKEKKESQSELEALQLTIEEMRNASKSTAQENERVKQALQAKDSELSKERQRVIDIRKESALTNAAAAINPFEVGEVVRGVMDSVQWDDVSKSFVPVDPKTGQPRLNSSFEPMSLEEFFAEYATKKPYMVRSTTKAGIGSTENARYDVSASGKHTVEQIFGRGSDAVAANRLAIDNPKEYKRLREQAVSRRILSA